ncbi:histidine kinase [uncultured Anaerococcus sp.]|uniref:histidine kinase n=1 Tax=uncultured Anaerococcus sp. TaxID=293428 RepID=UPI0025E2D2CF|nr:histidine kinase [uncultured Anaerococcus sp.]
MGLLFNSSEDMDKKVRDKFGDDKAYLLVFKHNSPGKGLGKLLLSKVYYVMDSSRTFILYFDPKGVYESEISNTDKKDFLFMAWNEIEDFELVEGNKKILKINHLGKVYQYEVEMDGKLFKNNYQNLTKLKENNWYRVE